MGKTLVAYFSASGVTGKIAERIAEALGADIFQIKPAEEYTLADLNWNDSKSRSSLEMNDKSSRVAIAEKVSDMASYDRIIIGYPIWWGVAPHIINSFLESYDLSGKTIIPFASSGGSGIGNTDGYLGDSVKGGNLMKGRLLKVTSSKDEIKDWLDGIG
ncbi:MAG: NAD(P)H-dependent oxidoreductase [Lachnospiraceae bacterium]|nr:NAD(P)H-dependent oxidoreductase [Lachnospiraceae bacterium]